MGCDWNKVALGSTPLMCSPLGLGSSYGVSGKDIEYAFERGINYFYWGSRRSQTFGGGLKRLAKRHREQMCIVIQSYTRVSKLLRPSLEVGLRRLRTDYADVLLLGWWNEPPPPRIMDAALELKARGKIKAILISGHKRTTFPQFIQDPNIDAIMVRYNAAHTGAENEVFPSLKGNTGVVAYTATRWGDLLKASRVGDAGPVPRGSDCYRFVLTNPNVNVCIAGPANRAELDEALDALERGPMTEEEMAWMRAVGAEVRSKVRLDQARAVDIADRFKDAADGFFRRLNA